MDNIQANISPRKTLIILTAIMALSVLFRTVPFLHFWPNFTPVGALALFSGAMFWNRKWMFVFPLAAMLAGDVIKEIIAPGTGFYQDMVYVYGAFFIIGILGVAINGKNNPLYIGGASLLGSVIFFLVTNFGAWTANNAGSMILYTKDFAGLMNCYAAGVPFFKYTLFSDLFFNTLFFGGFYFMASIALKPQAAKATR